MRLPDRKGSGHLYPFEIYFRNKKGASSGLPETRSSAIIRDTPNREKAGVAQWQSGAFVKQRRGFDSSHRLTMTDRYDKNNVHLTVYAGAGGDDAKDWANMLARMYVKYAVLKGWKATEIDDRSFYLKGEGAYGRLKREFGVHRLVRISPFSSKNMRHTSFALVEVLPELPRLDAEAMRIPAEDLKIEMSRGGGPGGQNVNKVETAVRIIHVPTGLSAASRAERSQIQNRERALSILKAKIFRALEDQKTEELTALKTKIIPEWGNQIRSYVLHPYKLVKDHRTKTESHDPERILGGELDKFIESEIELKA